MAHDLRGPFTGFLGLTDLMAKGADELSVKEIKKMSEAINKSATSVYKLIEDLLLWSRAQTNSIPFNLEEMDMYEIIFNTVYTLSQTAANKNVGLFNLVKQDTKVKCDRNLITTVVRNLTSNAIKFSNFGDKIEIGIDETGDQKSSELCVYVKDTGIGIAEPNLSKLFKIEEEFSTPGTNKELGTGLGLIICKEFVEKHGGRIWVESELGKGSTFYFTIP